MAEQTFLNENGITITNARFVVPAQTYAMSGVTSVGSLKHNPSRKGPIILGVVGVAMMLAGEQALVGGLVFLASAVAWWMLVKPKYSVLLHSSSGEAKALTSKDSSFIDRVIAALNEAIISRG